MVISWKSFSINSHSGAGVYVQGKQTLKKDRRKKAGRERKELFYSYFCHKEESWLSLFDKEEESCLMVLKLSRYIISL